MTLTPEKLGLYEVKYLEILHDVLEQTLDIVCHLQIEEIVVAYGKKIKEEVLHKQNEQTESEATNDSSV